MTKQPDLPEPAHADLDSMLSRKFGKEVANYFSGSPLNRVGFLRTDNVFLSAALKHPSTSFLLCNDLQPLVKKKASLAYISYKDVEPLIGDPYSKNEDELVAEFNSTTAIPQMIFLGLDERVKDALVYKDHYKGAPFFALDVTPKGSLKEAAEKLISTLESRGLSWAHGRAMDYPASEGTHPLSSYISPASFHRQDRINKSNAYYPSSRIAAIYAEARQLLDWNARNPFCAQCGQPTLSTSAGFKRTCPPKDMARAAGTIGSTSAAQPDTSRPDCATRKGISNLSFPRTDPTVIMAVVSADNKKLLLGRQKRWPPYWYSTLAGFCEPAESVEEAVRREVWEEAGVLLGRVVVHSTQPWPYPANLMIGAIGQAIPEGEKIHLGHDAELDDAKWFDFDEIREALRIGTSGLYEDAGPEYKEGGLRLPPSTAIAHQLMAAVCGGFLGGEAKM